MRPLGSKVLAEEPGAFRTANITASPQIADYEPTVGPTRQMPQTGDGAQPGDPAKAAAAILTALTPGRPRCACHSEMTPSTTSSVTLDAVRAEIANWEKTARNTRLAG